MIELIDVSKVFHTEEIETHALSNVSFSIKKGEFVSIMGPSGCGKSTMLNIIGMLDDATSGDIIIDGISTSEMTEKQTAEFRNRKLGFIFQNFHLIPALSIIDNVELPLLYRKGVSSTERREKAETVLDKVGLSHRMMHFPNQISGGQNQRAAIARALIGQPEILLADEPTGNLDSKTGNEILELLMRINRDGTTIVMVTHDEHIAAGTNRIIRFIDGKIAD